MWKEEKHIYAQVASTLTTRFIYSMHEPCKQCIYFITDISDGRDNNKIDIVQYELGVAYTLFWY